MSFPQFSFICSRKVFPRLFEKLSLISLCFPRISLSPPPIIQLHPPLFNTFSLYSKSIKLSLKNFVKVLFFENSFLNSQFLKITEKMTNDANVVRKEIKDLARSAENLRTSLENFVENAKQNNPDLEGIEIYQDFGNSDILRETSIEEPMKTDLQRTLIALAKSKRILRSLARIDMNVDNYYQILNRVADEMTSNIGFYVRDRKLTRKIKKILAMQKSSTRFEDSGNWEDTSRDMEDDDEEPDAQVNPSFFDSNKINYHFNIDDSVMCMVDEVLRLIDHFTAK